MDLNDCRGRLEKAESLLESLKLLMVLIKTKAKPASKPGQEEQAGGLGCRAAGSFGPVGAVGAAAPSLRASLPHGGVREGAGRDGLQG